MKISDELRQTILENRKKLGLSLTDISTKSGVNTKGKPLLSVSTLSAIEKGKQVGMKEESYKVLAEILKLENGEILSAKTLKVAFGPCCWAAPLINAIVDDTTNQDELLQYPNLLFTCYTDESGKPIPLEFYNQSPESYQKSNPSKECGILTANESLSLLKKNEVDIVFLPVLTAERETGIVRIARSMNTGKGGVYLFIIGRKGDDPSPLEAEFNNHMGIGYVEFEQIKKVLNATNNKGQCCFVFPKGSIAQREVEENLFDETQYEKHGLNVSSIKDFEDEIKKRVVSFFEQQNAKYFVYAGWDYHIDKLMNMFPKAKKRIAKIGSNNYVGIEFDGYRFTKPGYPFPQMSYDCITLESKYDYLIKHPGLHDLLSILSKNINVLNQLKESSNNSRYRLINNFLGMNLSTTNAILKRINWEILIYPEMFDKNLK
jgi:transcriptional regulator with XRE-family HTH domain